MAFCTNSVAIGFGFDGIIYDSALRMDGYNVSLINGESAKGTRREKGRVTDVELHASFTPIEEVRGKPCIREALGKVRSLLAPFW
jgi:hypothetical protein